MTLSTLQLQDCMTIVRAFERGAQHAMTEESVFAVLSPRLDAMRSMAKSVKSSMEDKSAGGGDVNLQDAANPASSISTAVPEQNTTSGKSTLADKIHECVPCKFKINFKEKFNIAMLLDPDGLINQFSSTVNKAHEDFFKRSLDQINKMLDMLQHLDNYVDLCAMRRFLSENVCIPDLQRIMAVLTAYLMKLAINLNGSFGSIVSLFGGLLMPFLGSLVDQLMKFLMAAIKPMECVIESLQRFLTKIDYNVLFKNIDKLKIEKAPILGKLDTPVSLAPPIQAKKNQERADIAAADKELKAIQEASLKIDGTDRKAQEQNRAQATAAKKKLADAHQNEEKSEVGKLNENITEKFGAMKGALVGLITQLRKAVGAFEDYIKKLVGEIVKLLNQFMGAGNNQLDVLGDKLQTIQLMALIQAIIKAIKQGSVCANEGEAVEQVLANTNLNAKLNIWTDEDGTIHIDEDGNAAIEDIAKAFGLGDDPRQKFKGLVQFTGDKLLDSGISRAVETLTNPRRVKFKCPLQTSVASAEKVNKWISELNAE